MESKLPMSIRKHITLAAHNALHPVGMSTNSGKGVFDANEVLYLLRLFDALELELNQLNGDVPYGN